MNYRPTDTLREVIFKTLAEVKAQSKVRDLIDLANELAEFIEANPELLLQPESGHQTDQPKDHPDQSQS